MTSSVQSDLIWCGLPLVVDTKDSAADNVVVLCLRAADGALLPAWTPGAHVDLVLPSGAVRQYSLCGDPGDRSAYRLAVLREASGRGGSQFIHDDLAVGDHVIVRGPRNNFPLVPSRRYLFIAGGIGITPVLPMLAEAESLATEWRLLYGGRHRRSMAFLDDLAQYGDKVLIAPEDEVGLLDLGALLSRSTPGTKIYCCGPESLISAVANHCAHWQDGSLHVERFRSLEHVGEPGSVEFEVVLQRSGVTCTVSIDKSILEVVEDAGIPVPYSCMEGTCGSCETDVLSGVVDHRDSVLDERERMRKTMMICVSRSLTPTLILDL